MIRYFLPVALVIIAVGAVLADDPSSTLVVSTDSTPTLVVDARADIRIATGADGQIRVTGLLEPAGGRKIKVTRSGGFALKETPTGVVLKTDYPERTFKLHLTVEVPVQTRIVVEKLDGRLETQGLAGSIRAEVKNGAFDLRDHAGSIDIALKNGRIDVKGYSANREAVRLNVKNGEIAFDIAAGEPGPGTIRVVNGRLRFRAASNVKAAVQAQVQTGIVRVTPSLTQPEPNAAYYTLNGGGSDWNLMVDEGEIAMEFAKP